MTKDYHETKRPFGYSDIARLTVVGIEKAEFINFGKDGGYCAYIIDETYDIPEHYELVSEYDMWAKFFDDDSLVAEFKADKIKVYRSGMMGLLIQLLGRRKEA